MKDQTYVEATREVWSKPVVIPKYKPGNYGEWDLVVAPAKKGMMIGYFTYFQDWGHDNYAILKGKQVWMSITPMEVESQLLHARLAKGRVVVMGLGMGVVLANLCANPDVTYITVIEKDASILEMFRATVEFPNPRQIPIDYMQGDAKLVAPLPHDTLIVDIWPTLASNEADADIEVIAKNWNSSRLMWWGMEFTYFFWAMHNTTDPAEESSWAKWKQEKGFRIPKFKGWPVLAYAAAQKMVERSPVY